MPASLLIELSDAERADFHRRCRSGKTEARLKERRTCQSVHIKQLGGENVFTIMVFQEY